MEPGFRSVSLKYHYVKPTSYYQRYPDMVRSFAHELGVKKRIGSKTNFSREDALNLAFHNYESNIKKDKKDRIIEWTVWDHSIKNSANIHSRSEYSYNENGELTEIRHSSTWGDSDFELNFRVEISYHAYDAYGNWLERTVKVISKGHSFPDNSLYYIYKRQFDYYE